MANEPAGAKPRSSLVVAGLALAVGVGVGIGALAYFGASADPNTRASNDPNTPSIREPSADYSNNRTDAR